MNKLFFGKIPQANRPEQLTDGFYEAPKSSSWFGDINIGDYCFAIGNNKIQFWRAKEWKEVDGNDRLYFDIINENLNISINNLIGIKYFKWTKALIVLTSRSSKIAFHELDILNNEIDILNFGFSNFYNDKSLYRKIKLIDSSEIEEESNDIQFYKDNDVLKLQSANFYDDTVYNSFRDNTSFIGKGSKNKDNTLGRVLNAIFSGKKLGYEEISYRAFYDAFFCDYNEKEGAEVPTNITSTNNIKETKQPLNQILYGPPGTGKTYHTINKALAIIEGKDEKELEKEERSEIKSRFDKYINLGQIVFTTFHQSLGYEDFVEGIKPDIEEDKDGVRSVVYEKKDGIFKELCNKARVIPVEFTDGKKYHFEDAWNELISQVQSHQEIEQDYVLGILTPKKGLKITEITNSGNLRLTPKGINGKEYTVSFNRLKVLQNAFPNLSKVKNIDKEFRSIIGGMNSTAYWACLNFINNWLEKTNGNRKIKEPIEKPKPHVLIIDEINRGNVSQIFGELITLIEKDKRAGEDEALEITLPYSHERFSVPNNLYIIGTMNTADRSVEALDTALRRRFSFEQMLPKPSLLLPEKLLYSLWKKYWNINWDNVAWLEDEKQFCELFKIEILSNSDDKKKKLLEEEFEKGSGSEMFATMFSENAINFDSILLKINERLEALLSSDHLIGHSYFMGVYSLNDLKDVFYDKIIPLLQEYFYGDYGKIGLVLGYGFVFLKEKSTDIFAKSYYDVENIQEKDIYEIIDYRFTEKKYIKEPEGKKEIQVLDFLKAIDILLGKKTSINEEA